MLMRSLRWLGYLTISVPAWCRWLVRSFPDPMRLLGWMNQEKALPVYDIPAGKIALVNDLRCAETVLTDRAGIFPKSPVLEALLRPLVGSGVFGRGGGEEVKRRRKTYLKVLSKIGNDEVERLSRQLAAEYLDRWMLAPNGVPVPRELSRLTVDIVTTMIYGDRFTTQESERFVDLFFEYHRRCNPGVAFFLPRTEESMRKYFAGMALEEIGDAMREMMRERFLRPWQGRPLAQAPAFMQALLDEVGSESATLDEELLLDEMSVMILAGHETSASVLSWLFWEVSGKPALFDEALEQRADPSAFRARIDALVQETLRLFPPIAFYLREAVEQNAELDGQVLPKGSFVAVSPWAIQRNRKYWPDASSFCPMRWLKKREEGDELRARFMPFGFGSRFCPGKYFAEAEMRAIVEEVATRARLERVAGRDPLPLGKLTSRPDHDFCLKFVQRA